MSTVSSPLKAAALRGLGEPTGSLLVVDPGGTCGLAFYGPALTDPWGVHSHPLDSLPGWLSAHLVRQECGPVAFVVCEDFHLLGGKAVQQSGSPMPAPLGIGMVRTACEWTDTPLFLVPPNTKRAGHQALDDAGHAAYDACRNDHQRDVVDIAGYVLREMRRPR